MARTPIHPGEVLVEELEQLGVSPTELSRQVRLPANRISQIIKNGKRAITGDTALRLAHWFGTSPQFWMDLQALYDLRVAEQDAGTEIKTPPIRPAKLDEPPAVLRQHLQARRPPLRAPNSRILRISHIAV